LVPDTATAVTGQDRLSTRTENADVGELPASVSSNVSVSAAPEMPAVLSAGGVVSCGIVHCSARCRALSLACWCLTNVARRLLLACALKYALRSRIIRLRYAASAF